MCFVFDFEGVVMKKIVLCLLVLILVVSACTAVAEEWICPNCGKANTTKFCTACGAKHDVWVCPSCGSENTDAFCGECGAARPFDVSVLCGAWKYSAFGIDEYLVFKENGEWYAASSDGNFVKGSYKATATQFTVRTVGSEERVYDYRIQDNQMRVYQTGIEYYRSGEPGCFVLSMDGASMNDTLDKGDVVTFTFPDNNPIRRFDIVANYYPERGDTIFIKRVVGLPGDTVELQDGYLYVNGEKYEEPYINDAYRSGSLNSFMAYTVPDGMYFVMGDHRNNSNDSRSVGPLDEEMIIGVAIAINGKSIK